MQLKPQNQRGLMHFENSILEAESHPDVLLKLVYAISTPAAEGSSAKGDDFFTM
jgi:hypothetical protein